MVFARSMVILRVTTTHQYCCFSHNESPTHCSSLLCSFLPGPDKTDKRLGVCKVTKYTFDWCCAKFNNLVGVRPAMRAHFTSIPSPLWWAHWRHTDTPRLTQAPHLLQDYLNLISDTLRYRSGNDCSANQKSALVMPDPSPNTGFTLPMADLIKSTISKPLSCLVTDLKFLTNCNKWNKLRFAHSIRYFVTQYAILSLPMLIGQSIRYLVSPYDSWSLHTLLGLPIRYLPTHTLFGYSIRCLAYPYAAWPTHTQLGHSIRCLAYPYAAWPLHTLLGLPIRCLATPYAAWPTHTLFALFCPPSCATGLCEDLIKQNKGESRYSTRPMVLIKSAMVTDRISICVISNSDPKSNDLDRSAIATPKLLHTVKQPKVSSVNTCYIKTVTTRCGINHITAEPLPFHASLVSREAWREPSRLDNIELPNQTARPKMINSGPSYVRPIFHLASHSCFIYSRQLQACAVRACAGRWAERAPSFSCNSRPLPTCKSVPFTNVNKY
ncbi:hypothetical protein J6590_052552 [Homalodisca vitripennis]|nr:hypothetical protein J6590_052552 [Homalodisca vitripennis]